MKELQTVLSQELRKLKVTNKSIAQEGVSRRSVQKFFGTETSTKKTASVKTMRAILRAVDNQRTEPEYCIFLINVGLRLVGREPLTQRQGEKIERALSAWERE